MKNVFHHVHHHIKKHHKKYLFGVFGGFAIAKLFLLVFGLSIVEYSYTSTFADLESGCIYTGGYSTGAYQTGGYRTGEELIDQHTIGCTTLPGYRTGGTLDELGEYTGRIWIEETQTGCLLTGTLTGGYWTGAYRTGAYRTGASIVCTHQNTSGNTQTGALLLGNGICESGDILWSAPISGSIFRDIFPITWSYSGTDCVSSLLSLQLRDHNNQRITLGTLASGATLQNFDSKKLYSPQLSGFYHVIGTGTSGQQYYLYTGIITGAYSRLFTGYKIRLLNSSQTSLYETSLFTIDNEIPVVTGITLLSSGSSTGYLNVSGIVMLTFTASEVLSGLQVTLGSGKIPNSSAISGLRYTYTRVLSSLYTEGILTPIVSFVDAAGNTGSVLVSSSLIFDITRPSVTGFVFAESAGGIAMNFTGSEPVRYTLTYQKTGGALLSGSSPDYLTAQQMIFSGIQRDQLYIFTLTVYDRAGNSRSVTGDMVRTNLGAIIFHISLVPVANEAILSGSLATLGVILKAEVEKFNLCKDNLSFTPVELEIRRTKFILQMPMFKKSQMKTLVNAFTLFVLDKIKTNTKITSNEVTEITKKFDSFLVVLKLLRDDDNICKQNLSNYHISQFKRALEEYKISVE